IAHMAGCTFNDSPTAATTVASEGFKVHRLSGFISKIKLLHGAVIFCHPLVQLCIKTTLTRVGKKISFAHDLIQQLVLSLDTLYRGAVGYMAERYHFVNRDELLRIFFA